MNGIFGREDEQRRLWSALSRYTGGVIGYYGMSGLGKTTVLDLFEQQIKEKSFTPYVARLDFADSSLRDPAAAFTNLLDQLEATGATTQRTGLFKRNHTESPLQKVRAALQINISVKQEIKIAARASTISGVRNMAPIYPGSIAPSQLNEAVGQFKLGIAKLPITPLVSKQYTALRRPLVVVLVDTLELAPPAVIDWLKQLGDLMFQEYLLLIAGGQERIDKLLTEPLNRIDEAAARQLLSSRFQIFDHTAIASILQIARGIPRCICLAAELIKSMPDTNPADLVPDKVADHLVGDYLVRGILKRMPDSTTEKHLLTYGCVLQRWENTEQLQTVLFGVEPIRDLMGAGADIHAALMRLRERSFLDSGHPHPTLRDLLLRELVNERPDVLKALHRSAADYFIQAQRYSEAIYHLLAIEDWETVLHFWQSALEAADKQQVITILTALTGRQIPQLYAIDLQIAQIQSGLLLQNGSLLTPLLTLAQDPHITPAHQEQIKVLTQQVIQSTFVPQELRLRLQIQSAETSAYRATALLGLGAVLLFQGRYGEAEARLMEGLAESAAVGDRRGRANALRGLGEVLLLQGRYGEAEARFMEGLAESAAVGDRLGRAYALRGLISAVLDLNQAVKAQEYLTQLEQHLAAPESAEIRRIISQQEIAGLYARLDRLRENNASGDAPS